MSGKGRPMSGTYKHVASFHLDAIEDLCAEYDITVEGIVALVGGVFYVDGYEASVRPDTGWDNCLTHLRRLARGEEA